MERRTCGGCGGRSVPSSRLLWRADAASATEEELDHWRVVSDGDVKDAGGWDSLFLLLGGVAVTIESDFSR